MRLPSSRSTIEAATNANASRFMATVAGSGGRLLAADDSPHVLSGTWPHDKLVLLQFPDRTRLDTWANSPEYVEISSDRIAATTGSVVLVAGVAPPTTAEGAGRRSGHDR
jgi:uncharacterized protein (DUF1330 family)